MRRLSTMFQKIDNISPHIPQSQGRSEIIRKYSIDKAQSISILTNHGISSAYWGHAPKSNHNSPCLDFTSVHTSRRSRMEYRSNRCIVLLDSFYAWSLKERRPIRVICEDASTMFVPALYFGEGDDRTVSLLCRKARKSLRNFTPNEPLIMNSSHIDLWLKEDKVETYINLLATLMLKPFSYHIVTSKVLVSGYNEKDLHEHHNIQQQSTLFS